MYSTSKYEYNHVTVLTPALFVIRTRAAEGVVSWPRPHTRRASGSRPASPLPPTLVFVDSNAQGEWPRTHPRLFARGEALLSSGGREGIVTRPHTGTGGSPWTTELHNITRLATVSARCACLGNGGSVIPTPPRRVGLSCHLGSLWK